MERNINRIKVVLVDKRKTNKWLSEQLGVAPTTVSKWCTNVAQPNLETLMQIAMLLEVQVDELLRFEELSSIAKPANRPVANSLSTISLKAKDFAAEMTSVNVQQKDLHGMTSIEREHIDNNKAVRDMLLSRGIVPEQRPAGEDVKKVESRLASDEKKMLPKK